MVRTVAFSFMVLMTIAVMITEVGGAPTPADFPYGGSSFDEGETWKYCGRKHMDLSSRADVPDYGVLITNALKELSEGGGGAVRLLNGIYNVTSPIRFMNNTCLLGQGTEAVNLRVSPNVSLDQNVVVNRGVLHAVEKQGITIRDLTIQAGSFPGSAKDCEDKFGMYGTYFEAVTRLRMADVRVLHACAYGIALAGNDKHSTSHVVLRRVRVDSVGNDGIKVELSRYVSIMRSTTINNGRHGLHVAGSNMVVAPGSLFAIDGSMKSQMGCGILITDLEGAWTSGVTVTFARVLNAYRAGICVLRAKDVLLADATINNSRNKEAPCYEITQSEKVNVVRGTCKPNQNSPIVSSCEGLRDSGVCCPSLCGKCGGKGCSKRAPHGACCVKKIREVGNLCASGPPPCNLVAVSSPVEKPANSSDYETTSLEPSMEPKNLCDGLIDSGVCCPKLCGKCGGEGCSKRGPGGACCVKKIRASGKMCADSPAPCNLDPVPSSKPAVSSDANETSTDNKTPRPSCDGLTDSGVCCPKLCGKCGGENCSKRGPDGVCCVQKIRDSGKMCADSPPPCNLDPVPSPKTTTVSNADDKTTDNETTRPVCDGLANSGVCCPKLCGKCGGEGCSERGPDGVCCVKKIRATGKMCSDNLPPCNLNPVPSPYPTGSLNVDEELTDDDAENPTCDGLFKSGVCCPKLCGKCGGVGCSKRGPDGICCVKKIRATGKMCSDSPPPCNVVIAPTPKPTCDGLVKSGVCCPKLCGTCGGIGCSKRAPNGICCVKKIRASGKMCADSPAPCNLVVIPTPKPACDGLIKSGVCCPKLCGKCGGISCSKRAPNGICCVKKIRARGKMCADGPPPCNLVYVVPSPSHSPSPGALKNAQVVAVPIPSMVSVLTASPQVTNKASS